MGKSNSKLKKKRSQSIAWSFRFPSLTGSLSRRVNKMPGGVGGPGGAIPYRPHMDIRQWLAVLELPQYQEHFDRFNGVEELLTFSEADIKDLGVKNSAHRARIVSSLFALKSKYENGTKRREKPQRHSVAVDSRVAHRNCVVASDILVVSEVIQSKSLCNLVMDSTPEAAGIPGAPSLGGDPSTSTAPLAAPSPSSPNPESAHLRKALELELSLDSRDLRSHAWYHGQIPRSRAEEIVERDGDFLVRDCTSQPGNYVLTCRCKSMPLHFVINKSVIQPETVYERVQFQFEDEAYDTVPDLITFYVGSGRPITLASGARIQTPRNRIYPLSFYATKYGSPLSPGGPLRYSPYNYKSPAHSPPRSKREIPPRLPSKKQRSQSLTPSEMNGRGSTLIHQSSTTTSVSSATCRDERSSSADGVIQNSSLTRTVAQEVSSAGGGKYSTHSLPRPPSTKARSPSPVTSPAGRVSSEPPTLSPCLERRPNTPGTAASAPESTTPEVPPPKPSRIPSLLNRTDSKESEGEGRIIGGGVVVEAPGMAGGGFHRVASYHASGSDSGNGSGDSAQSSATGPEPTEPPPPPRGVVIKNPRYHARAPGRVLEYDSAEEANVQILAPPDPAPKSAYDLDNFHTLLLPSIENKPLDSSALQGVRMILQETGPRVLANHLTRVDLELTVGVTGAGAADADLGLGVSCGLELIALPHGSQLRRDLIERTECLKLLVSTTILTCPSETERAELLNKWILVAIDTKTALGNLYGFCGIMMGLCLPQVQRLSTTWHVLRQRFTDSAFNFEAKLRPTLKSMNECTNPQAPNTTIPHLLPFVLLQERTIEDILGSANAINNCMSVSYLGSWETSTTDLGLTTVLNHLETARKFANDLTTFRRNAEIVLAGAKHDDLVNDTFRTEFQLKFLWGSRGANVDPFERRAKFEQVLAVMSEKCEPPAIAATPPLSPTAAQAAVATAV